MSNARKKGIENVTRANFFTYLTRTPGRPKVVLNRSGLTRKSSPANEIRSLILKGPGKVSLLWPDEKLCPEMGGNENHKYARPTRSDHRLSTETFPGETCEVINFYRQISDARDCPERKRSGGRSPLTESLLMLLWIPPSSAHGTGNKKGRTRKAHEYLPQPDICLCVCVVARKRE